MRFAATCGALLKPNWKGDFTRKNDGFTQVKPELRVILQGLTVDFEHQTCGTWVLSLWKSVDLSTKQRENDKDIHKRCQSSFNFDRDLFLVHLPQQHQRTLPLTALLTCTDCSTICDHIGLLGEVLRLSSSAHNMQDWSGWISRAFGFGKK